MYLSFFFPARFFFRTRTLRFECPTPRVVQTAWQGGLPTLGNARPSCQQTYIGFITIKCTPFFSITSNASVLKRTCTTLFVPCTVPEMACACRWARLVGNSGLPKWRLGPCHQACAPALSPHAHRKVFNLISQGCHLSQLFMLVLQLFRLPKSRTRAHP